MDYISLRYRLKTAPTEAQQKDVSVWNEAHLASFGVSLRLELRADVWYLLIDIAPPWSGIGRPPKKLPPPEVIKARQASGCSMYAMAREYGVSRATLYRHLAVDSD